MKANQIMSSAVLRELEEVQIKTELTQSQKKRLSGEFIFLVGFVAVMGAFVVYNILKHGIVAV